MKRLKLKLWHKTLLSLAAIGVLAGTGAGLMIVYAFNSDEVNGTLSPVDHNRFLNDFSRILNAEGKIEGIESILDPQKKEKVANVSDNGNSFSWVGQNQKMNFDQFFKEYHEKYNDNFIQEVKYGSFSFLNEYVLAVRPKQFTEFTEWFIKNVAWGPDLLTLDSFRLVPGVETNGNSIILGSHSTINKEESEIKFFPDAFFGSMPLYSKAGGAGNASDALTDTIFNQNQDRPSTEKFLKSIPFLTAAQNNTIANLSPFKDIFLTQKLIEKTILVSNSNFNNNERVILKDMSKSEFENYVNLNFPENDPEKSKLVYSNFTKYSINSLQSSNDSTTLFFDLSRVSNNKQKLSISLKSSNISESSNFSAKSLKELSESDLLHFLDFYDLNSFLNKRFFVYPISDSKFNYYASKAEAVNSEKNFDETKLKNYELKNFSVLDGVLNVRLEELSEPNDKNEVKPLNKFKVITFDSKNVTVDFIKNFLDFKNILGYKGAIKPVTLVSSPEDPTIKIPEGIEATTLDKVKYQLYGETYPNLLEIVSLKYPQLLRTVTGPHVVQKLNDQGYYDYEIQNGDYKQFTINDRIGLPTLLFATDENYEGISTDFLKYVAAHEYGHHITLEKTQAIDSNDAGVVVNGLSSRSGVRVNNYYNFEALDNYLKARSNIEVERVNARGQVSPTGVFTRFKFIKNDGTVETETYEDIWGAKEGDLEITHVLSNRRRRFLQDFNGLERAAKLRNVRLSDLFLANSIDHNSGTINPFIVGPNEVFSKNEKGEIVFKPVRSSDLLKEFTDGAGNKLQIENERIKVFDKEIKDGSTIIKSVLIKNKDGSDVVKVPLNEKLSASDLTFVNRIESEIRANFRRLIITTSFDSGWNNQSTSIGDIPIASTRSLVSTSEDGNYAANLFSRTFQNELNPDNNIVTADLDKNNMLRLEGRNLNINQDDSLAKQLYTLFQSSVPDAEVGNINLRWLNKNTVLQFVSKTGDTFSAENSYIVSDSRGKDVGKLLSILATEVNTIGGVVEVRNGFYDSVFRLDGIISNPRFESFNLPKRKNRKVNADLGTVFKAIFNQEALTNNRNNPWVNLIQLLNEKNQPVFNAQTQNGQMIAKFDTAVADASKSDRPVSFTTEDGTLSDNLVIGSVHKIGIDMNHGLFASVNNIFGRAFNRSLLTSSGGRNFLTFEKLQDFINFVSIDYSKATRVVTKVTEGDKEVEKTTFNWDINYVKEKFDFNAFKAFDRSKSLLSEQEVANNLMKLFSTSLINMLTKNFKIQDNILDNWALFSEEYGVDFLDEDFKKNLTINETKDDSLNFNPIDLKDTIDVWKKTISRSSIVDSSKIEPDLYDLLFLAGNKFWYISDSVVEALFGSTTSSISSDVINYNSSRAEDKLNDIFTDYVYSLAETLTRDFVQTTYIPSTDNFGNLPSYMGNANEQNTGIDYVIDTNSLKLWLKNTNNNSRVKEIAPAYFSTLSFNEIALETKKINDKYEPKLKELKKVSDELKRRKEASLISEVRYKELNKENTEETTKVTNEKNKEIDDVVKRLQSPLANSSLFGDGDSRRSSYFGNLSIKLNGYFKDRFQKKAIGAPLYDDDRNEVFDTSIRIKDFDGKSITSVPKAYFVSQLLNFGVSKRNISGLFRNKTLDALALYGYLKNDVAEKVKKIRFLDIKTGESKFLNINTKSTNNLFYLKKQGDEKSKVTLSELGYTSWVSDYALMGKYRDALLFPEGKYQIDFVDENNNLVETATLGNIPTLSENGKDPTQSPIIIRTEDVDNLTTKQKESKVVLSVDLQFNIQR